MPVKIESPDLFTDKLSEHDNEVLEFIVAEELSGFTFDGIRRRLQIHPETLSRILSRFEEVEIIKRVEVGYQVTLKAQELAVIPLSENSSKIQILQTYLPMSSSIEDLLTEMTGKWFNSLRWLGYSKNGEKITLKWVTSDSRAQIDAVFWDNSLNIEATILEDGDLDSTLTSSYHLLGYITKTIKNMKHIDVESFI